jgi:anti-anti-sigma factor
MSSTHTIATIGNVTVLRLQDPRMFDFERIPATTQLLDTFLKGSPTDKTLVNFGQIEFYNSMSLGLVAALGKKAERYGRTVSLCNLHPRSIWSIQATRLHTALDIYHDEEQALARLNEGGEPPESAAAP